MVRHLRSIFAASAFVVSLLVFLAPRGAWAETYSSFNSKYPSSFENNPLDHFHNGSYYTDAVNFGGREIIFFTLWSDCDTQGCYSQAYKYLYFYTPEFSYKGKLDIGGSPYYDNGLRIKTCVLNNVLYIFYTTHYSYLNHDPSTIYYRTATLDVGPTGTEWNLVFSGEKSIPAGVSPATILFPAVMNGNMYIIYSSGLGSSYHDWYCISSTDGLTFSQGANFFTDSDTIKGAGGAVFLVPDQSEGFVERMMLAYATGSEVKYFFFDGQNAYGPNTLEATGLSPYSIRLIAGSAEGYSNTKYSVQAWVASPKNSEWSSLYHREYMLSGTDGENGSWSSQWNLLNQNKDDSVHNYINIPYNPDLSWAVITLSTSDSTNPTSDIQMSLRIWYARGTDYVWPSKDYVHFRCSTYQSDLLDYVGRTTVDAAQQDLSNSTVLGIIEGTPPFPVNGGVPTTETSQTSTVELAATQNHETSTAWTVGGTIAFSYGNAFLGIGLQTKLSAGLKYTKSSSSSSTTSTNLSLISFTNETPGSLGWALVLKPQILNDQYILKAYDGHALAYDGDTSGGELTMSVIQYGPESIVVPYAYMLEDPSSISIFAGMAQRPLSTDIVSWQTVVQKDDPSYNVLYTLPTVSGTQGEKSSITIVQTTTNATTWTPNASFSASAEAMGFGIEGTFNYTQDITTSTTMTQSLGFNYNIPECNSSTSCCVWSIDVSPYILLPTDDAAGYNAPWISDDIRNYGKPKPWCLSYTAHPDTCGATSWNRLTVNKAKGMFFLDRAESNRDRMSAKITLKGLAPNFSLDDEQLLHLRFGNYIINTDANPVLYRGFEGKDLVLELSETENSDSFITVRLSYDIAKSLLDIELDADQTDLRGLYTYPFLGADEPSSSQQAKAVPFRLFLGDKYHADTELDAHCVVNDQNAICNFHSGKK